MTAPRLDAPTGLEELVEKWLTKANEKGPHGGFYRHSERTIATLRECANELEAALLAAGAAGRDVPREPPPDVVCEHGTAMDVHCCNCHSGFIFDLDHECPSPDLSVHRCKICGTRWLLWPEAIHGGGWNLLDKYQRPGACCDNVAMGDQIEHLRDIPLSAAPLARSERTRQTEQAEEN